MPLGEDVCKYATATEVVRNRAITNVTPYGEYDVLDRISSVGAPMPPSGVEQAYTDRFDNRTYY